LNEVAAAAVQRKELQGQLYWMSAGLECMHNLDVMARMLRIGERTFLAACNFKGLRVAKRSPITTSALWAWPRASTHRGETNALGLQKILELPRRCCSEIDFPKMSPLIRLHRSNNSKHTIDHQGSRGNSLSRKKLQCRDSGLDQSPQGFKCQTYNPLVTAISVLGIGRGSGHIGAHRWGDAIGAGRNEV